MRATAQRLQEQQTKPLSGAMRVFAAQKGLLKKYFTHNTCVLCLRVP